ncbi:serine/threonine-protein kinase [Streptomyces sp. NBC_00038]|uniref:serine/threonine-protein kinase n=1 Tax=Streptomyces sp. NBC_00038 TaxID=2903615 RepID=UPI0022555AC0|nr:serine/threonine-protein kinase [Streptomyces sp. NBC_00038]MCX5560105.1 protein kinase [Streptomyces sp. NBC_00038]
MGTEGDNARVIAGRYRLEARIGRGGMGVVWRATDQLLGRQVAVKEIALDTTLSADEARQQRDRTLREARAVAQLRHPHIIVVHDVVEDDERPYIVMELIEGGSLAERISARGPVDAREAARIGIGLLGALRRAHDAGVLHRDLKPANVLIAEEGRVVLTDFGIAQVAGATTLTESGAFVGSPEYTAPERMSGVRTGPESDLWSLGVLLCTVLSGESPFHRDSLGGILHAVVIDEIRPPAQAGPLLPVVRGLLERDPERRLDAAEAERMLRAFRDTGRTPRLAAGYTPTQRDVPARPAAPAPPTSSTTSSSSAPLPVAQRSTRGILVAAALVAAMAGAGVSAAALLMNDGGGGGTPAPSSTASTSMTATSGTPGTPGAPGTSASASVSNSPASPVSHKAPSGYRTASDPNGFSLAVPDDFTREPEGERVFYVSQGKTFRLGIKVADPEPGGPLEVMRRGDAKGPSTNPGYRDAAVTSATHGGQPAAFWEFTWNGFTEAEGARHTYDLCWEEGGRMYDVWVSAPVGRATEAKEYFDVAVDTFVPE